MIAVSVYINTLYFWNAFVSCNVTKWRLVYENAIYTDINKEIATGAATPNVPGSILSTDRILNKNENCDGYLFGKQ